MAFGSPLRKALKSRTVSDLIGFATHRHTVRKNLRTTVHKNLFCAKLARKP
jgi:hypothetical protein